MVLTPDYEKTAFKIKVVLNLTVGSKQRKKTGGKKTPKLPFTYIFLNFVASDMYVS